MQQEGFSASFLILYYDSRISSGYRLCQATASPSPPPPPAQTEQHLALCLMLLSHLKCHHSSFTSTLSSNNARCGSSDSETHWSWKGRMLWGFQFMDMQFLLPPAQASGAGRTTELRFSPQTQNNHCSRGGVIYHRQLLFPKGFHCQLFSPNQCYQSHL